MGNAPTTKGTRQKKKKNVENSGPDLGIFHISKKKEKKDEK